jgi:hypothetical protein
MFQTVQIVQVVESVEVVEIVESVEIVKVDEPADGSKNKKKSKNNTITKSPRSNSRGSSRIQAQCELPDLRGPISGICAPLRQAGYSSAPWVTRPNGG